MKKTLSGLILSCAALLASESFSHKDWQVVCDNTHTCRMAGYTEQTLDNNYFPISILLERKAGANSHIDGYIQTGVDSEDGNNSQNHSLIMLIDHKSYAIDTSKKLPRIQTDIFLNALIKEKKIRFTYGKTHEWIFSQNGSFSVMLKMDDYQKRIGTVGAIYKKGNKNEDHVLQAKPIPIIYAPSVYSNVKNIKTPPELTLSNKNKKLLQKLVSRYYGEGKESECWMDIEEANKTLKVYRLTETVALASQQCWMAAYNHADAFWLINANPPFEPKFVTTATDLFLHDDGTLRIHNAYKGRGLGDCWESDESIWDGEKFVGISNNSTGLCRGFAGGAWNLPTLVTEVKVQNSSH